ncbi:CHASE2 domain-containing protein [Reinekea sp.]|jgi:adenylate cyclase|uniref:CHASE2 domain-containing protein n=2 Tax=Reinekea sp. TaxID=1970455 RepID=UPI0039890F5B
MSFFTRLNNTILKGGTKNNRLISLLIALAVSLFSIFFMEVIQPNVFEDIEGSLLDARFQFRGPIEPSGLVNLVSIDDKSIEALGRWPWPRDLQAAVIEEINNLGAVTIGLDVIYSEPEGSPVDDLVSLDVWTSSELEKLQDIQDATNRDMILTTAIFMAGNVVNGQFFYFDEQGDIIAKDSVALSQSKVDAVKSNTESFRAMDFSSVTTNIDNIAIAGVGAGFFNQIPESDGVVRSAPLVIRYQDELYPSLALKTLAHFLDDSPIIVQALGGYINKVIVGDLIIETNEQGGLPINYRGPKNTIPTFSALDVLQGKIPQSAFEGRMVLLGSTAIGVFDSHSAPFGAEFPGLEIQASVIENIAMGDSLHRNANHKLIDIVTILLGCLIIAVVIPFTSRSPTRVLFYLTLIFVLLYGNYFVFSTFNHWNNLFYPMSSWTLCFVLIMLYQGFMVEARYSHVRSAFKHYLSPALVDQLTANPDLLNFGGEEKELSILFSDIRSFTNLSETVTPSELSRFLQAYMDPMTDCVLNNNGTLDKYIGDAVMAIFGAPVPFATHPIDACQAAVDMIEALEYVVDRVPDLERLFPVRAGIGVHTGTVVVGNLGSSQQFNYTVIGDAVNLAARIESLTKNYGVDIMISDVTYERVKEHFVCRELDRVRVKGKQEPVDLYELQGKQVSVAQADFNSQWQLALIAYRQRKFSEALAAFSALDQMQPKNVTLQLYLERCEHFITNPVADDWDGVYTHTSK